MAYGSTLRSKHTAYGSWPDNNFVRSVAASGQIFDIKNVAFKSIEIDWIEKINKSPLKVFENFETWIKFLFKFSNT